jgi:hypothetical protein
MDCRCKDLLVFDLALNHQKFPLGASLSGAPRCGFDMNRCLQGRSRLRPKLERAWSGKGGPPSSVWMLHRYARRKTVGRHGYFKSYSTKAFSPRCVIR